MNDNELKTQLQQAFNDCITAIGQYTDDELNAPQGKGRWTKAQLAQHVVIATGTGFDTNTKPADRPHDQWAGDIEKVFTDYSQKYNAPEMTKPELKAYNKAELIQGLKHNLAAIEQVIETKDITKVCQGISLPGWGELTRHEWLVLMLFHVKRHTMQMNDK